MVQRDDVETLQKAFLKSPPRIRDAIPASPAA
jgi:hypothetical protein